MASTKMKIRESEQKLLDAIMNGITFSFAFYIFLVLELCRLADFSCPFEIWFTLKTCARQTYSQLYKACTPLKFIISSVDNRHFWA